MRKFEDEDEMYEFLMEFIESEECTPENFVEANWGVSPGFLIEAAFNAGAAESAQWMKPLMFITGVSMGMISAAIMSIEEPLSLLLF